MTDELWLLRSADPLAGRAHSLGDQALDDRATSELHALLAGAPPRSRRGRWGLVAAGAAAVLSIAVVVGTSLLDGGAQPAYAATPPLLELDKPVSEDAAGRLREIAAEAAGSAEQPASRRGSSWDSWSLTTRIDGDEVTSAVVPEQVQLRWTADRSGSLVGTAGEPYFPTREHRQAWQESGHGDVAGTRLRDQRFAIGEFTPVYPQEPPPTAEAMTAYLGADLLRTAEDSAGLVAAVSDLYREWRPGAVQRAAVLQVLAGDPDVETLGTTTDRLGRSGEAFGVESDASGLPTRYVLVVDPTTGQLLASEQWLTADAGRLDVPVPSVIAYTAFRD